MRSVTRIRRASQAGLLIFASALARGQNYELVQAFPAGGQPSAGPILAKDGFFYGTTAFGGVLGAGSVYRADSSGNVTTLHSFTLGDGASPAGPLLQASDGNLYGITIRGGANGAGTAYRMDATGAVSTLHDFLTNESPQPGLTEASDGSLYGAMKDAGGRGAIFQLDRSHGSLTVVHLLNGSTETGVPIPPFLRAGYATLYGTTSTGQFFRLTLAGTFTVLATIPYLTPVPLVPGAGGLYGTTRRYFTGSFWHPVRHGSTAIRVDLGGAVSTLHTFSYFDGDFALLAWGSDGAIYRTPAGALIKMDAAGKVTSFPALGSGVGPLWPLAPAGSLLYGVTSAGGASAAGMFFRVDPSGTSTTLHSFGSERGAAPWAALIRAKDGSLYGTASAGGPGGAGTIFRISGRGGVDIVHDFQKTDGANPQAALILASDGSFYGTTSKGGDSGLGTVFRMDSSGAVTTLHSIELSEGAYPVAPLLEARDGSLYGTTSFYGGGGTSGGGTVFRIDSTGVFQTVHTFDNQNGAGPLAPLIQTADGSLYGTTCCGGTVFKIDGSGSFSTVHYFGANDKPRAALLEASDGNLYGTSSAGVFKIDSTGAFSVVHAFTGQDGADPRAGLVEAADGVLYGTASAGGPADSSAGQGVVFRLGPESLAVNAVAPTSGPARAGSGLRVLGGGFEGGALLSIGGAPATGIRRPDPTWLAAMLPALSPGTLNDVSVANPGSEPLATESLLAGAYFADFSDVPQEHPFHRVIEAIFRAGVTLGCGNGNYCPSQKVSRSQIAILVARAMAGGAANIPSGGTVGASAYDCSAGGASLFSDVAPSDSFCKHIHYLAARNVDVACAAGAFCPTETLSRLSMASFVAEAIVAPGGDGAIPESYGPDPVTGLSYNCSPAAPSLHFGDVGAGTPSCRHVHYLWAKGVVGGCSATEYCVAGDISRDQMAKFLVNAFGLKPYGP